MSCSNRFSRCAAALAAIGSLLGAGTAAAQAPLLCGQAITNTLTIAGQRHNYDYTAAAGELVTIRMVRLTGNLGPVIDLRDSGSVLLASGAGLLDRTLTNAGIYHIEVYDTGNNDTGAYSLVLQRRSSPCDATTLACGAVVAGALPSAGELAAYTIDAAGGEVVTLRLLSTNTTLFSPRMELYDPTGRLVTSATAPGFTGTLTNGGAYTLLVSHNSGTNRTGNYWLAAEKLKDACDFTALNCGDLLTNSIGGFLELDAYTFTVPVGGQLSRLRLESGTTGFTPTMELYDPLGRLAGSSTTALSAPLTNAGTHTLIVSYSTGASRTGDYRLAYERLTNACDALALNCGNVVAGALTSAGESSAYAINATGGELVTLRLLSTNTTLFSPRMELYDPTGRLLTAASATSFTGTLTNGGAYTLLVSYNSGTRRTGNYWLAAEKLKDACDFTALNCGDLLTNSIGGFLELDAYTFTVPVGGQLSRLRLESGTTGFTPTMELYDPFGRLAGSSTTALSAPLTNGGTHTLIVSYSTGASRTGDYRLAYERLTNACDALALNCGDVVAEVLTSAGESSAYAINATGGELVTLRLLSTNTTLFSPRMELFDPTGRLLTAASATSFTGTLTNGGAYTLLVSYNSGTRRTGNYWLAAEKLKDACDFTALNCGDLLTNSIGGFLELDIYTFTVPVGGQLSRLRVESGTTGFNPTMELYDPLGRLAGSSTTALSGALTNGGTHTLIVSYGTGASRTGDYRLAYERLTNACDALALNCGNVVAGVLTSAGESSAYAINAAGGEVVTLRLLSTNTTLFSPRMELYDPTGRLLTAASATSFTGTLTNTGPYTLLVSYNSGSSRTGNYLIATERLKEACDALALNCGLWMTNQLGQVAEIDTFTLSAAAGDAVALGIGSLTAGFTPAMELYDPAGRAIGAASTTRLSTVLTNAGTHTVLVRYNAGTNRTGSYMLFSQRLANPCNALLLTCGTTASGLVGPGEFVTRHFAGTSGEVVLLRLGSTATPLPVWEIYDPDGILITSSGTTITRALAKTGNYTVLLFPPAGDPQVVDYELALQQLKQPCLSVALDCGSVYSSSLSANGELDSYHFTGVTGEVWRLRLGSLGDYFGARMELFGPAGQALATSSTELTRTLTNSGNYTVLVSWDESANSRQGEYRLASQRLNAPCGASPLAFGQSASGAIAAAAQMNAFTFAGTPGPITLCLGENSAALVPVLELYNSAGVRLVSSTTRQIQATLTNSGDFHLMVQDSAGTGTGSYLVTLVTGTVSCATIDLQAPVVTITAPAEGTFITRETNFTVTWTTTDNATLAAHDVLLSLDGGATYPVTLASNLPGTARSFVWAVPDGFTTAGWRVRVVARDAAGNAGVDERDLLFLVINPVELAGISYRYDTLNRLTAAEYSDGTAISYAYDLAGNRTNWVVLAGSNADTDGDGLPDTWETANGLDPMLAADALTDGDGDRSSNWEEYLAGTNPRDSTSRLFVVAIEVIGTTVRITFTANSGKSYVVEQSEDLSAKAWIPAGASLTGAGDLAQFTQTAIPLPIQLYYRVRLLP